MSARSFVLWTIGEVQTFLCVIVEEEVQRELDCEKREGVSASVSQRTAVRGFGRTSEQCRTKAQERLPKDQGPQQPERRK